MNVGEVAAHGVAQIGGGSGYFQQQLREAERNARYALNKLVSTKSFAVMPGEIPVAIILESTRDSIRILDEVLHIEAPMDAVVDTRHALEALKFVESKLVAVDQSKHFNPADIPDGPFKKAIDMLNRAEHKLAAPTAKAGSAPSGNPGIVPPWLR